MQAVPPTSPISFQIPTELVSAGVKIKNALWGRVQDWKDKALAFATIYNLFRAAICFVTGHWISAIFALGTACLFTQYRKDIRNFMNFHKANGVYAAENHEHMRINMDQQRLVVKSEKQIQEQEALLKEQKRELAELKQITRDLKSSLKSLKKREEAYADLNAKHEALLGIFGTKTDEAMHMIRNVLKGGHTINKTALNEILDAVTTLKRQKDTFKQIGAQVKAGNEEQIRLIERVAERMSNMDHEGHALLNKVKEDIATKQKESAVLDAKLLATAEKLSRLEKEVDRLEGGVDRLDVVEQKLQKAAETTIDTTNVANAATRQILAANDPLKGLFPGTFGIGEWGTAEKTALVIIASGTIWQGLSRLV